MIGAGDASLAKSRAVCQDSYSRVSPWGETERGQRRGILTFLPGRTSPALHTHPRSHPPRVLPYAPPRNLNQTGVPPWTRTSSPNGRRTGG